MPETAYNYNVDSDFPSGSVSVPRLKESIDGSLSISKPLLRINCSGGLGGQGGRYSGGISEVVFSYPLTSAEEGALNSLVASHISPDLHEAKLSKMGEIDRKTSEIMGGGFTYQGMVFSVSSTMQRNLLALNNKDLRSALAPVLPFYISSMDNLGSVLISTVSDFLAFYNAAFDYGMVAYASGNGLKESVRQITNDLGQADVPPNYHSLQAAVDAVNAVEDNR